MDADKDSITTFLLELYRQTEGDPEKQASMQSVGEAVGHDKTEATALAEELMINELVELKTLAGGIGITEAGLAVLAENGMISGKTEKTLSLSGEKVLTGEDRAVLDELLAELRKAVAAGSSDYADLEEAVMDIKTLEVQLLSPRPKAAVAIGVMDSLGIFLKKISREDILSRFAGVFNR